MSNFILFFALSITLYILITIFGLKKYYEKNHNKFSFLNMFPFEFFIIENKFMLFCKIIHLVPLLLLMVAGINLFALNIDNSYVSQVILAYALLVCGTLSFLVLNFIEPKHIKLYLIFFVLLLVSTLVFYAINSFIGISSIFYFKNIELDIKKLVVGIISFSLFITYLIFVIISTKKPLFNMDSVKNDDGTISHVRPKKFNVAYMQWLSILSLFINTLLTFFLFV